MTKRGESHNNAWHTGKEMLQKKNYRSKLPIKFACKTFGPILQNLRETCEEAGLRVRIGQRVNSVVFECSIEPGTSPNPHTNCPWEVQYGVWLTYEEAKRKGRYAYRDNGNAWGGLWDLIKRL